MSPQNTSTLTDESHEGRMADIPLSPEAKLTVERRGRLLRPGQGVLRLRQRPEPAGGGVLRPRRELLPRHRRGRLRAAGQDDS
jgi:hypothetical protein